MQGLHYWGGLQGAGCGREGVSGGVLQGQGIGGEVGGTVEVKRGRGEGASLTLALVKVSVGKVSLSSGGEGRSLFPGPGATSGPGPGKVTIETLHWQGPRRAGAGPGVRGGPAFKAVAWGRGLD